jgi:hypothetical protein
MYLQYQSKVWTHILIQGFFFILTIFYLPLQLSDDSDNVSLTGLRLTNTRLQVEMNHVQINGKTAYMHK